jgi:PAS domain S-box-containing protein
MNGESLIQAEIERVKGDGSLVPCVVNAAPLRDQTGEITGIIETFTDITERKLLQSQVRETEERFSSLIDLGAKSGEAIVVLQDSYSAEGVQVFANNRWPEMNGYAIHELIGTSFFNFISPEDRLALLERYHHKKAGRTVADISRLKIIHKNGTAVPVELADAIITYEGRLAYAVCVKNATNIKQAQRQAQESEERYHSLFDDLPIAVWEADYSEVKQYIDGLVAGGVPDIRQYFESHPDEFAACFKQVRIIDVNDAVVSLWEATSKQQVITRRLEVLESRPCGLSRELENVVALINGATRIAYQVENRTIKGKPYFVHVEMSLAPKHQADWSRVIHSFIDNTDRVKAEDDIKKQQETLEDRVAERSSQLQQSGE